ncbi:MAG: helix-turn-helix transcriptional regulator [Myxococcales bacterium]|nr:helix-turn-helix transcriptional regulator [Myxococcales bacterium]
MARRIAALRQELGLTQEELASKLGIAHKNVQRLESGRQNLTLQTLARVAKVLEVTPARSWRRHLPPP